MSRTAYAVRAASVLGFLFLTACTIDVGGDDVVTAGRGASPEALEFGTCVDSCGDASPDGCWCDDQCESFGDCCADYEDVCLAVQPPVCAFAILCAPDTWPTDTDGDGCEDTCETVSCFDDSQCPGSGHCTAEVTDQCCPPNALCSFDIPPCEGTCTWEPPPPPPLTCASVDCAPGYVCQDGPDGATCVEDPNECYSDDDCEGEAFCDHGATCAAIGCPPPPPNVCRLPTCDDGTPALCEMLPPVCADDEVLAVRNHCYSCLPADSCEPSLPPPPPPGPTCAAMLCGPGYLCVDGPEGGKCVLQDGFCENDDQCGDGEFCQREEGLCGATGQCETVPEVCYEIFAPVCGCDGQTYSNDCHAHGAGTSVASFGECGADQGCLSDDDCADGESCTEVQCVTWPCPALCLPTPEPPANSCTDSCGGQSETGSCWCDDQCATFGDCCEDVDEMCAG